MPNFFTENADMQFQFNRMDLREIVSLKEGTFAESAQYPYAPTSYEDAMDGYRRVLEVVGRICGDVIAPRAPDVDREGAHYENGKVTYAKGTQEALKALSGADLMGYTLPRKYGGLNLPTIMYASAIEMVSRADAALMTIFGLQDIAETINSFASEEQKQRYLPKFTAGQVTGAMVLTEPDAGSDLQAVRLKAHQDANGVWRLNGVKRFITNGCGDVLLVLARSEEGTKDGRGLSMFICEKGPKVFIRRIEDKMGIHGSPTCEIHFRDAECELVGQRRRGLTKYVMSLMNGARIGIAAQGLGIAEAAYRDALVYALDREQFGKAIIDMAQVADMLVDMKIGVETSRSLLYETARIVDLNQGYEALAETIDRNDPRAKEIKEKAARYRKEASLLTPMSKYYCCENCLRVTNAAIQVLGGSGFMRDYNLERYYRDARITTIYEGTSELQVVAMLAGLHGENLETWFAERAARTYEGETALLAALAGHMHQRLKDAMAFVKQEGNNDYTDLMGKRLGDMVCYAVISYLLLDEAQTLPHKRTIAEKFIRDAAIRTSAYFTAITSGNDLVLREYKNILSADIPKA
jgi:alkylation response protein AidB-like acyl-CoA dehydrogenase